MKVIRLNESDIQRIVKRVLSEQQVKPKYDSPPEMVSRVMEVVMDIRDYVEDIQYQERKEPGQKDMDELRRLRRGKERPEKLLLSLEKQMGIPEGTILKKLMEDWKNGGHLKATSKYLEDWEENQKG